MKALKRKLLIFAKAPIAGHAKSRMIPLLGAEGAAELHQELVYWLLSKVCRGKDCESNYDIELWCASDIEHPFFVECTREFNITLKLQQGDDLGERQFLAMKSALRVSDYVVVVGSDVASVTADDIANAFEAIEQGAAMVIAPAADGGYGLIGGTRVEQALFNGIPWGGEQVYKAMVSNLNRIEPEWQKLPEVWDLDQPDDLARLRSQPGLPNPLLEILKVNGY